MKVENPRWQRFIKAVDTAKRFRKGMSLPEGLDKLKRYVSTLDCGCCNLPSRGLFAELRQVVLDLLSCDFSVSRSDTLVTDHYVPSDIRSFCAYLRLLFFVETFRVQQLVLGRSKSTNVYGIA